MKGEILFSPIDMNIAFKRLKHLAFYMGDRIDVGVEILPMKSLQSQKSSWVDYYED